MGRTGTEACPYEPWNWNDGVGADLRVRPHLFFRPVTITEW